MIAHNDTNEDVRAAAPDSPFSKWPNRRSGCLRVDPWEERPLRERFTAEEWGTLEFLPLWVFTGVAGIDGNIDHDETRALARELAEAIGYADPLAREVLTWVFGDCRPGWPASLRTIGVVPRGLKRRTRGVDAKLTELEAASFKTAMLHLGNIVAESSNSGIPGAERVSDEEKVVLGSLISIFGLLTKGGTNLAIGVRLLCYRSERRDTQVLCAPSAPGSRST